MDPNAAQKALACLTSLPISVRRTMRMPNMIISRASRNVFAWITESHLMGLPPKDPGDDEDENEQDEENDDEDDEPAVIREPNE